MEPFVPCNTIYITIAASETFGKAGPAIANPAGELALVDESADLVTDEGGRGGRPELAPVLDSVRRAAAAAAATLLSDAPSMDPTPALPAAGSAAVAWSRPAAAASHTGVELASAAMRLASLGVLLTGGRRLACMAVGGCVVEDAGGDVVLAAAFVSTLFTSFTPPVWFVVVLVAAAVVAGVGVAAFVGVAAVVVGVT